MMLRYSAKNSSMGETVPIISMQQFIDLATDYGLTYAGLPKTTAQARILSSAEWENAIYETRHAANVIFTQYMIISYQPLSVEMVEQELNGRNFWLSGTQPAPTTSNITAAGYLIDLGLSANSLSLYPGQITELLPEKWDAVAEFALSQEAYINNMYGTTVVLSETLFNSLMKQRGYFIKEIPPDDTNPPDDNIPPDDTNPPDDNIPPDDTNPPDDNIPPDDIIPKESWFEKNRNIIIVGFAGALFLAVFPGTKSKSVPEGDIYG